MEDYEPLIDHLPQALFEAEGVQAAVLRDDVWGGPMQGNKWRKLRYNLEAFRVSGKDYLLTFGGAYSNHVYATAFAAAQAGIPLRVIVRGEEPARWSPTLQDAAACGAQLQFVSREQYRIWSRLAEAGLAQDFPGAFVVPEGGNNAAGAAGCENIASIAAAAGYTHICLALGTGTTASGVRRGAEGKKLHCCVYPVLKGLNPLFGEDPHVYWRGEYHGGGYARITDGLLQFGLDIYQRFGIPLDPVYTAKLFYGVFADIRQGFFTEGSRILMYHSGGMQGARGFPAYYEALCAMGFRLPG